MTTGEPTTGEPTNDEICDAIDPTVEQIMREFHGTEQRVQPRDGEGK